MRNYIFRGKKVYGDGWAYGSLVKRVDYCCILEDADSDEIFMDAETGVIDGNLTPVRPETVGAQIIDGIFEGDIIDYCNNLFVVSYNFKNSSYSAQNHKRLSYIPINSTFSMMSNVIGNIHDNPELTEV